MPPLIEALRALITEDVARFRKAATRAAGLYALAAVLGLTAYGCAVAALVLWAARHADPVVAAGVAAAGFAALALVVLAVVALLNRAEKRRRAARAPVYSAALRSAAGTAAGTALAGLLLRPAVLAAGMAMLIAGLALGALNRARTDKGADSDEDPPSSRG